MNQQDFLSRFIGWPTGLSEAVYDMIAYTGRCTYIIYIRRRYT